MSLNYIQRSSPSPSKAHRESARSLKETWEHCCYQTWQRFWNCSHGQIWICPSSKRSFYRWIGNATKFARIDDKRPKRGGAAHRKVKWMNVVSLWGVNCRFRSQLGCLRCKVTICPSRYRLVLCIKKFSKNALTLTTQKSPLGVSLNLSHAHIGSPSGDLIWIFLRASSSLLDGSPPVCPNLRGRPRTTFTYFFGNRKMYIQSYIKYCLKTLSLPFLLVPSLWASQDTQSQKKLSMRPILSPTGTYNFNLANWLEETNRNHLL